MTQPTPPQAEKRSYKQTLNLPKTAFAMKANLVQREPLFQKRWERIDLYRRMLEARAGAPLFTLHDGPPYANGSIHLGHLLNKVLKDLVVRSQCMLGHRTPFVPGWDCHGLPIEHKVVKELGPKAREMDTIAVRRKCRAYAEKYIKLQMQQMKRLGTVGEYDRVGDDQLTGPYLSMDPAFEAATLEVFADLVERGLVFRQLKPVHWSIENRTALADAELEYEDREDTSVYVLFEIDNPQDLPMRLNARPGQPICLMIWTTTPWTLPANLAVAAAPRARYSLCRYQSDGHAGLILLADDLAEKVLKLADPPGHFERIGSCTGEELEKAEVRYRHPFIDRTSPLLTAEYVTLEDGTGLVHTAPGHGVEDYHTGLKHGLDIYCPVKEDGRFDETAPEWLRGKVVWEGNGLVVEKLRESGHLFHAHQFTHSYPHDWRSKTPTIFRATEQWFVGVDIRFQHQDDPEGLEAKSLRQRALTAVGFDWLNPVTDAQRQMVHEAEKAQNEANREAWEAEERGEDPLANKLSEEEQQELLADLDKRFGPGMKLSRRTGIKFLPQWGQNRMRGMLENRPDWCVSRQRAWGLPIPAFFPPKGTPIKDGDKDYLLTPASIKAVAGLIREKGSDVWFLASPKDLLVYYDPSSDKDAPAWVQLAINNPQSAITKSSDIFDVWFESGSSWNAVIRQRGLSVPVDLYLEGSDQHRGWFQSSLLPALGVTGRPPYKAVLTHGFMVDKHGRKMSKSLGNTVEVEDLLKELGADVCRWWVASLNTNNDIKVDMDFFREAGEEYRKVRNTIRFLLSNLDGFDNAKHRRELTEADAHSIDAWAAGRLAGLIASVRAGYGGDQFAFRLVREAVFNFCNDDLSAVYLAATKDRLYCDRVDSDRRRRTQMVMHDTAEALILLIAPILVHTADEAWLALKGLGEESDETVHTRTLPEPAVSVAHGDWPAVMELRDRALKRLEEARSQRGLDNPLDAGVEAALPAEEYGRIRPFLSELADLCGVSRFTLDEAAGPEKITVHDLRNQAGFERCERSWKRDGTVKQRSDGGLLSDRDAEAVGVK